MFLNFVLTNPAAHKIGLNKNWGWAYAELFDRLTGANPGTAFHFRPRWLKKLESEGGVFDYSYGETFAQQLPLVWSALKRNFDREAIISVWSADHVDRTRFARRPCTLTIQLYNRQGKLHCFVNMRSSDIINLLPYDVFHHTSLQIYIASVLGLELGNYHHTTSQFYWPKRRELRNYGPTLLKKLTDSSPPTPGVFPWILPRESVMAAKLVIQNYVNELGLETDQVPDPYIKELVNHVVKGKDLDDSEN